MHLPVVALSVAQTESVGRETNLQRQALRSTTQLLHDKGFQLRDEVLQQSHYGCPLTGWYPSEAAYKPYSGNPL